MSHLAFAENIPETATEMKIATSLLDEYFLNPESLLTGNPIKAYTIMNQLNRKDHSDWIDEYGPTLKKCVSAGSIKTKKFLEQYGKLEAYQNSDWHQFPGLVLAEEASKGEITGKPDNLLALKLVCRSNDRTPYELISAVDFLDASIKDKSKDQVFDLCAHVESSAKGNWCTDRKIEQQEMLLVQKLNDVKLKLTAKQQILFDKAYETGLAFIKEKAATEERHSGSLQASLIMESALTQKQELLEFLKRVTNGDRTEKAFDYADKKELMEQTLDEIFGLLEKFQFGGGAIIRANDVSTVQNLWEKHAKTTAEFASSVDQSLSQIDYETMFISTRLEQLMTLLKSLQWDVENEYTYPK